MAPSAIFPTTTPSQVSSQPTSPLPTILVVVILSVLLTAAIATVAVSIVRSRHRSRYGTQIAHSVREVSQPNSPSIISKIRPLVSTPSHSKTFVINLPLFSTTPIKVYRRDPSFLATWVRRLTFRRGVVEEGEASPRAEEVDLTEKADPAGLNAIIIPSIRISDEGEDDGITSIHEDEKVSEFRSVMNAILSVSSHRMTLKIIRKNRSSSTLSIANYPSIRLFSTPSGGPAMPPSAS